MTQPFTEFHAHIYFNEHTQDHAQTLFSRVESELSSIKRGRFHTRCVGPHPQWMFTMEYTDEAFQEVTLWLLSNLDGLSALVHPLSGNDVDDHTKYALWFSQQLELNFSKL